ncbi:CcdC protein domain-containing protein [Streptomyces odontomachi]|uniref:CcdC protein domain-containing protein n=1 Tax=Streptomyces odontomachi TaxID=2944940 RepID=UPI00210A3EE7|nr:CcdC protein domain-containing protein [Streptomyces sp. ODS25]
MSGLTTVLVVIAVVALVVIRQIKPQRATGDGRWWLVPAVLAFLALREPGLMDAHHYTASVFFLAADLLTGIIMGIAWAWTSRIWTEPDGSVWVRGTKATAGVWIVGILVRVGLVALAALMGVHQGRGALMLALAFSLLVRSGLLAWRAQLVRTAPSKGGVHGAGAGGASRKDPV